MLTRLLPLIFASIAFAQVPTVQQVWSIAFSPGSLYGFSPGSRVSISYTLDTSTGPNPIIGVIVGGKAAYIVGSNPYTREIDAQIPFELPAGPTTLTVSADGKASAPFSLNLDTYAPGIISPIGNSPGGFGAFLNSKGSFASPQVPANVGDVLLATATGLGPTNPPTPSGAAPNQRPTASPVTITIGGAPTNPGELPAGGIPAEVLFAGLSAGSVGLYEVKFKAPPGLHGTQPLYLTVGGKTAPAPVNIPLFGIGAVVSNASFGSPGITTPGSIVSIFANGLGTVDQMTGFPATSFQGVSVSFNGIPAPLFHLSSWKGQIDLIVPSELPTTGTVAVEVTSPGGTSKSSVSMAPAVPAFYRMANPFNSTANLLAQFGGTAWLAMPPLMAAALNLPGNCTARNANTSVICAQPAAAGDYLVLYATGLGKTTPDGDPNATALPTGANPPANGSVLYKTVLSPTVTIGGVPATVLYSGLAPGFAGLYQINIQVPDGVATGDNIPVGLSMLGGGSDNSVTLAVRPRQ